jgi:FADH2 O2-dependent halogenase
MNIDSDLAIVGSGFGGSLLAMIAKRLGRSVILLERGKHPRFAIGESSTPLANLLLEELALRYDLPRLLPLTKWGPWQKTYPEIGCGLKRGFTFYHHVFGRPWERTPDRHNELLVTASPHDGIADTHWYRPDFDQFLVQEAQALGVEFLDEVELAGAEPNPRAVVLAGSRRGQPLSIRARFVVDATGPRGFLHRALALGERPFDYLPPTQALYAHFSGVKCWDGLHQSAETPPYAVDNAAMHHVFDGGWIWVLPFNNGVTSAGVAATSVLADKLGFAEGAPAWERLLACLPSVREQFAEARAATAFVHAAKLPFRASQINGERWALLPSAAGFVDPLLSTGFPLTLFGIGRLADAIERDWDSPKFGEDLASYAEVTSRELLAAEHLIAALYAQMDDFPLFSRLTLIYFAAAIFSETARRLGKADLTGGKFLLIDHSLFASRSRECLRQALGALAPEARMRLLDSISTAIELLDLAGLNDQTRRNWFPVEPADLYRSAHKLGADAGAIERLLDRCGFNDDGARIPAPQAGLK